MADEVWEKSPGEVVTIADRDCEATLGPSLMALVPGSVVVGEEACSETPDLLRLLSGERPTWLLDPLDGTSAFAAGSPDHGVMVALVVSGEAVLSVIHQPGHCRTIAAERGCGAWVVETGQRLSGTQSDHTVEGAVMTRFLPSDVRARIDRAAGRSATLSSGAAAACVEYPAIASGARDFILYWRTLAWDHVPGALVLTEAGGLAAHLDATPYRATADRAGLLVARNPGAWASARTRLGLDQYG